MVFSCLSLTTTPWRIRFGIVFQTCSFPTGRSPRRKPISASLFYGPAPQLRSDRLEAGDVAANDPHARGVFELSGGALEAEIELLFLEVQNLLLELIAGHDLEIGQTLCRFHDRSPYS
ncbi:hypothetical protein MPC4_260026 [Methylocella tundrae]|uniref:Uncharacterized protein n=1 Tax=Methylocella tundrae TaxID=227605 RepID=A0A8B6M6C2_METTU|nr:hypothetical protein MPC1_1340003 [Methylocella tundrae]VTZ50589.1 hypothetical protein MPC4_260026 [Methylocella tundrae]